MRKMGRIKVLFRSLCFDKQADRSGDQYAFNQSVDVSHLATPHVSAANLQASTNQSRPASNPSSAAESAGENTSNLVASQRSQCPTPSTSNTPVISAPNPAAPAAPELPVTPPRQNQTEHLPQQPLAASNSQSSTYSLNQPQPPLAQHQPNQRNHDIYNPPEQHQQAPNREPTRPVGLPAQPGAQNEPFSYDFISVREPLAKIAERQQFLAQQQQIRQTLGDHEYIEVYGERGSSCFYEEIAGSVTSSATYDQIGDALNHNYQALINAYAVGGRLNPLNASDERENEPRELRGPDTYDEAATMSTNSPHVSNRPEQSGTDQVDNINHDIPGTSKLDTSDDSNLMSQSMPVYSVINKANRRANSIFRTAIVDSRPPEPPPKNPLMSSHQQPTSAIRSCLYQEIYSLANKDDVRLNNKSPGQSDNTDKPNHHSRLPQPPPRLSKLANFSVTDRPLPLPDKLDCLINNNIDNVTNRNPSTSRDEDNESPDNGYELLRSNFDDDQIDVGYEKIRESNRYSGSTSSRIYARRKLDNDGYESVQPIYSSPSNALIEPNYEAIAPATASELAAAATAKLTAAATVINYNYRKD